MDTSLLIYLLLAAGLLITSFIVFRRIVRRDYQVRRYLSGLASLLQLIVFAGLMGFPYIFNPPEWPWFWKLEGPTSRQLQILGLAAILLGFIIAFGTMIWFGLRRAFGLEVKGLVKTGPYRISRNPQVSGGYLLVIGIALQWPSWYGVGWVILYGVICHWMILTEEEHLLAEFGEAYQRYRAQTPRYLLNFARYK